MSNARPRPVETVIFDLDDTLITWADASDDWRESTRPHMSRVHAYLTGCGHSLPDEATFANRVRDQIRQTWEEARQTLVAPALGQMIADALAGMGLDAGQIDVEAVLRAYEWGPMTGVVPYPDTFDVLDALRDGGYKLGLVTNSAMPMWMRDVELEAYGLLDYFDARITSGDSRYIKPHPAIYERILALLDTAPDQAIFVGDNPQHDIIGANEAGLTSVLIDPPHLARGRDGIEPDFVITRLSDLLPIIHDLNHSGAEKIEIEMRKGTDER